MSTQPRKKPKTLQHLWEAAKVTRTNFDQQFARLEKSIGNVKIGNLSTVTFSKAVTTMTDFAHMDELIVSDTEQYFYKQWDITVYQGEASAIDDMAALIAPNLTYNILFQEPETNPFAFYTSGQEMKNIAFYEIKDTDLILHVSLFLSKPFDAGEIINPQVSLEVAIRPLYKVIQ